MTTEAPTLEIVRENPELDWSERICASWRKSVEAIVETGRLLVQAKQELPHGGFETMVETKLPFGKRTARMLMQIANHPVLADRNHGADLPASWRTLAELSKLSEAELRPALAQHKIRPDLKREDVPKIRAWAKRGGVEPQRRARRQKPEPKPRPASAWDLTRSALEEVTEIMGRTALAQWKIREALEAEGGEQHAGVLEALRRALGEHEERIGRTYDAFAHEYGLPRRGEEP